MADPATELVTGLQGIRVLEVAGGVGVAYAAKLFADLGADVIRVEAAGDVVRNRPHDVHRWLNTNKRSVMGGFDALVGDADLVLHDQGPTRAEDSGLRYADLAALKPALVVCSITPFGMTGPYADFLGEELTVIHGSSWGNLSPSASTRIDLPPLKAPGHHATINAATIAATAALAACRRAAAHGIGAHVDFSVFAAAAKMTETAPVSVTYHDVDPSRLGVKIVIPWNIYRCADGLIQFICPEESQWRAFVELMGNPEWAELDVFSTAAARRENADLVDLYVSEWVAGQRVQELAKAAQARRICMSPVNTMSQLDADPHFEARGFFATNPDGLRLPGAPGRVDPPWWGLRSIAPAAGEHDGESWRHRNPVPSRSADDPAESGESRGSVRPLNDVRICDFTWVWAGPFCTQLLAHLGADVIKLESPDRPCLFRRLPYAPTGTELTPDSAGVFHLYNTDKRSVGIDLTREEARGVVERLVAISDVVIDNFGVGTMARLGYGPDDLRRINPNVIVVSLSGYGQDGPAAQYVAYGPAGGAVAGLYAANGYEGGDASETGIAIGDPGTGIAAAWLTMAALMARERTCEVATIDVAMVEAVAATIGEPWMQYLATGKDPAPGGNHDPQWCPHACYPAIGEDRWVTIACTSKEHWQAVCSVIDPSLADDPKFADVSTRKANESALDERISRWTAARDRWETTRLLQAVGVPTFPSLSPQDLWSGDQQLRALGMLEQPHHSLVGARTVPGVPWRIHPGPNGLCRAAPLLGEHTVEVCAEVLGMDPATIAGLVASGVLRPSTPVKPVRGLTEAWNDE